MYSNYYNEFMKGLIFIVIIYALTLTLCVSVKFFSSKLPKNNKRGSAQATPKIYYVTTKKKQKKKPSSTLPIKASVVEKERFED